MSSSKTNASPYPTDEQMGRQAKMLQSFMFGVKRGMAAEEEKCKPPAAESPTATVDTVIGGVKEVAGAAAELAPAGTIAKGASSAVFDVGSLIVKAIINRDLAARQAAYSNLSHVLKVATVKRSLEVVQETDNFAVEITGTYSSIIAGLRSEEEAADFGESTGKMVINYIYRTQHELQAYEIWAKVLRGMIIYGGDYDPTNESMPEIVRKYGKLASKYFDEEKTTTTPPPASAVVEAYDALKKGQQPPESSLPGAVLKSTFSAMKYPDDTSPQPEKFRRYPNIYYFGVMRQLADLLDTQRSMSEKKVAFAASAESSRDASTDTSQDRTLKEKIRSLSLELRERLFLRMIEDPNEKELKLLGYFINKELVRSLSFHQYKDRHGNFIEFFHNWSRRHRHAKEELRSCIPLFSKPDIEYKGNTYKRNSSPSSSGTKKFFSHPVYDEFPSEIDLLNEKLTELGLKTYQI